MSTQLKDTWIKVLGNGLFDLDGEPFFSWDGCYVCEEAGTVQYVRGFEDLEAAREGPGNLVDFNVCGTCFQDSVD